MFTFVLLLIAALVGILVGVLAATLWAPAISNALSTLYWDYGGWRVGMRISNWNCWLERKLIRKFK